MKEELRKNLVWLIIGIILILIYKGLEHYSKFVDIWKSFTSLMQPFLWGFVIAYFLIIVMRKIEKKFNFNRILSLIITYILFFISIALLIKIVVPIIVNNIVELINILPSLLTSFKVVGENIVNNLETVSLLNAQDLFAKTLENYTDFALEFFNKSLNSMLQGIINLTAGILNFIVGVIISIYILLDIDKFSKMIKKIINAFIGEEKSVLLFEFVKMCDDVFKNFFVGKAIDSFIIGILCYIGLVVIKAPYPMLSSLIVGILNMIPYIGPIIGAIPAIILALLVSPMKAIWVALFILVLQQVDGNIIGPKILGDKVGISPFSIILAITIGGGYFGIVGMLFAVPVYKVFCVIFEKYIDSKIKTNKNNISV